MTARQRLSLPAHGAVELLVGLALLGLPFALGLGPAGVVAGVATGIAVAGLGLTGDDALPLRTHLALDQLVVAALAGGAIGLAFAGDGRGSLLLGFAALAELALVAGTRWTRRG
jgi:hypothetical protein